MVYWSKEVDEILGRGLFLGEYGIHNWGLSKKDALEVIDIFAEKKIPIFGGDVYRIVRGKFKWEYSSWSYDPSKYESKNDFVVRSIGKARNYINAYKEKKGLLFSFVVDC